MGTITKYKTPAGREGYLARDSWVDDAGEPQHRKARFAKRAARNLKQCEEEVKAWLAQREADRSRGVLFEPSRELLGDAIDRFRILRRALDRNPGIDGSEQSFGREVAHWRKGLHLTALERRPA